MFISSDFSSSLTLYQVKISCHDNEMAQIIDPYRDVLESAPTDVVEIAQLGACDIIDTTQVHLLAFDSIEGIHPGSRCPHARGRKASSLLLLPFRHVRCTRWLAEYCVPWWMCMSIGAHGRFR